MANGNKTIFKSKNDWWVWCVLIFALAVIWAASIGMVWWVALIYGGGLTLLFVRHKIATNRVNISDGLFLVISAL